MSKKDMRESFIDGFIEFMGREPTTSEKDELLARADNAYDDYMDEDEWEPHQTIGDV